MRILLATLVISVVYLLMTLSFSTTNKGIEQLNKESKQFIQSLDTLDSHNLYLANLLGKVEGRLEVTENLATFQQEQVNQLYITQQQSKPCKKDKAKTNPKR